MRAWPCSCCGKHLCVARHDGRRRRRRRTRVRARVADALLRPSPSPTPWRHGRSFLHTVHRRPNTSNEGRRLFGGAKHGQTARRQTAPANSGSAKSPPSITHASIKRSSCRTIRQCSSTVLAAVPTSDSASCQSLIGAAIHTTWGPGHAARGLRQTHEPRPHRRPAAARDALVERSRLRIQRRSSH